MYQLWWFVNNIFGVTRISPFPVVSLGAAFMIKLNWLFETKKYKKNSLEYQHEALGDKLEISIIIYFLY
jgi:hypothetical protein